ncbi:ion transporter [Thalassotalea euphylliae]|uniref:Ion transporter n=2 Tax=Thalassotalea euphylliae TaxID=1655234 RepID=A0A3E0TY92_9GAMM|nr:ion transporter [Thalassotalea euphylliae]
MQRRLKEIDSSKWFQGIVIAVIILSALLVGAKTHNLPPEGIVVLAILDVAVTVFFVIELVIRFLAYQKKGEFFKSGWNIFDTIIVIGSLIPAGGSGVLIARLLRVFRVLRLVSMVPELRLLINALIKAIPRMGYIGLLMFVIFYIYAAIGSIVFAEINEVLWGDVSIAMLTLFRVATFEDWTDYIPLSFLVLFVDNRLFFGLCFLCQQKNKLYKLIASREVDSESRPSKRDKICGGWNQLKYSC